MPLLSNPPKFSAATAVAMLCLLGVADARAELPVTAKNAASLAAAETAFAHESETKGMRAAFLNALSNDGIVFMPDPQNGRKAWEAKNDSGGLLRWQPVLAVVAASGDFGYTTGPWTYKKSAEDKDTFFGQFVSIWRQEEGKWKLLFDLGTDDPGPNPATPALELLDNRAPNESATVARVTLRQRDRAYAAAPAEKFSTTAADGIRFYRPKGFPVLGKTAAEAALRAAPNVITYAEPKTETAAGGDLGFAWGKYSISEKTATAGGETGYYLHIWRKNEAGQWQLALDLLHPR